METIGNALWLLDWAFCILVCCSSSFIPSLNSQVSTAVLSLSLSLSLCVTQVWSHYILRTRLLYCTVLIRNWRDVAWERDCFTSTSSWVGSHDTHYHVTVPSCYVTWVTSSRNIPTETATSQCWCLNSVKKTNLCYFPDYHLNKRILWQYAIATLCLSTWVGQLYTSYIPLLCFQLLILSLAWRPCCACLCLLQCVRNLNICVGEKGNGVPH